jgi:hypothetical protein
MVKLSVFFLAPESYAPEEKSRAVESRPSSEEKVDGGIASLYCQSTYGDIRMSIGH